MNKDEYARLRRGMSDDVRNLNSDSLGERSTGRAGKGKSKGKRARPVVGTRAKSPSPLDVKFALAWRAAGGPLLTAEYHFDQTRRWRADYAHLATRTLIELEGGVAYKSRHTSPKGFVADCEKYNAATAQGWAVFRLPTGFKQADVEAIVQYIRLRRPT